MRLEHHLRGHFESLLADCWVFPADVGSSLVPKYYGTLNKMDTQRDPDLENYPCVDHFISKGGTMSRVHWFQMIVQAVKCREALAVFFRV